MNELQILFLLNEHYGKSMTLEQAIEALGQIVFTREALEDEGLEYDERTLILEMGDYAMNEN